MKHVSWLVSLLFLAAACSTDGDDTGQTRGGSASDPGGTTGQGESSGESPTGSGSGTPGETSSPVVRFGVSSSANPAGQLATLRVRFRGESPEFDALGSSVGTTTAEGLTPMVGYNQFWFAWAAFNAGGEVFGRSEPIAGSAIEGDGECAIPCGAHRSGGPPKGVGNAGIPALSRPAMVAADSPETEYLNDNSFVVGLVSGADVRAYPHNVFWWHEIVNDVVGGVPFAITHCPLTFSSITHDPTAFVVGRTLELGVSGRLFNSNLVFFLRAEPNDALYDPAPVETVFSQLMGIGTGAFADPSISAPIVGDPSVGSVAPRVPSFEMTWGAWRSLFPDTLVLSGDTGFARTYSERGYPYASYFIDSDTFGTPVEDRSYPEKEFTYGLRVGEASKGYPHRELQAWAREEYGDAGHRGVLNDEIGGTKIALVFDLEAHYVQAFDLSARPDLELVSD